MIASLLIPFLLVAPVEGDVTQPQLPQSGQVRNPHWQADSCHVCHGETNGQFTALTARQADGKCLSCHDGVTLGRDPHPIGRAFDGDHVRLPEGWPMVDGMLGCMTCHDVVPACSTHATRSESNAAMLRSADTRGLTGSGPAGFCSSCHVAEAYEPFNPHKMTGPDGAVMKQRCDHCHVADLTARIAGSRRDEPALIADEMTLCSGCHPRHIDWFDPGHLGMKVNRSMLARLATGIDDGNDPTSSSLPLTRENRIMCSTCHNPHPATLFAAGAELGAGGMARDASGRSNLGLRSRGAKLCIACHAP